MHERINELKRKKSFIISYMNTRRLIRVSVETDLTDCWTAITPC